MPEKLLDLNRVEFSNLLKNEENHRFLIERVRKAVLETFPDRYV